MSDRTYVKIECNNGHFDLMAVHDLKRIVIDGSIVIDPMTAVGTVNILLKTPDKKYPQKHAVVLCQAATVERSRRRATLARKHPVPADPPLNEKIPTEPVDLSGVTIKASGGMNADSTSALLERAAQLQAERNMLSGDIDAKAEEIRTLRAQVMDLEFAKNAAETAELANSQKCEDLKAALKAAEDATLGTRADVAKKIDELTTERNTAVARHREAEAHVTLLKMDLNTLRTKLTRAHDLIAPCIVRNGDTGA